MERIDDSIEFINSRPKPLALYAFTKNDNFQKRLVSETSSGSIMFNDVILQVILKLLLSFILLIFNKFRGINLSFS